MSDNENHPVLRSHAPWTTKSECYSLFLSLKSLPEGIYDPLEAGDGGCLGEEKGEFQGGLGAIMIVRYSETPVGKWKVTSNRCSIVWDNLLLNLKCY